MSDQTINQPNITYKDDKTQTYTYEYFIEKVSIYVLQ